MVSIIAKSKSLVSDITAGLVVTLIKVYISLLFVMILDLKEYNKLFIIRTYTGLLYMYIFCCFFQTGLKRCQYNHDNRIPIYLMKLKNISYDVHNMYVKVSCVICSNTFCTQLRFFVNITIHPDICGKLYHFRNLL